MGTEWIEIPDGGKPNPFEMFHAGGTGDEFDEVCEGSAAAPTASAGFLCVYTSEASNATGGGLDLITAILASPNRSLPTKYGAHLPFTVLTGKTSGFAYGTWAVKAP